MQSSHAGLYDELGEWGTKWSSPIQQRHLKAFLRDPLAPLLTVVQTKPPSVACGVPFAACDRRRPENRTRIRSRVARSPYTRELNQTLVSPPMPSPTETRQEPCLARTPLPSFLCPQSPRSYSHRYFSTPSQPVC